MYARSKNQGPNAMWNLSWILEQQYEKVLVKSKKIWSLFNNNGPMLVPSLINILQ